MGAPIMIIKVIKAIPIMMMECESYQPLIR